MTNVFNDEELIARLRNYGHVGTVLKAADRIEQLVATNEALTKEREQWRRAAETRAEGWKISDDARIEAEIKLAKAVAALEAFAEFDALPTAVKRPDLFEIKVRKPILRTLAEIKGESQDGMV